MQVLPLGALLQLGAAWNTKDVNQDLLPTWALLLLLAEAFYVSRWLARQPRLSIWITPLLGIGGVATLLVVWYLRLYTTVSALWQPAWIGALFQDFQFNSGRIAVPLGIVVLLALLWWRGLRLGRNQIEHEQVAWSFKIGFGALVGVLLLVGTVDSSARNALIVQLGLTLPIFLFVGLASLSLGRLSEIRHARRAKGSSQADPTRLWIMAMLVLSATLLLLFLGIEQAFSDQAFLGVVSALQPLWSGITAAVAWLAVGLAYLLYWIFYPLDLFIHWVFRAGQPAAQPTQPVTPQTPHAKGTVTALPTEWLSAGQWVLIGIGVLILLIILIRAFRGFASWRRDDEQDEERENLGAANVLGAQLRALLANLAARFQRRRSAENEGDTLTAYSVRSLYRRVLRQAAAHGLGRHAAETPQEFAKRLGPAMAQQVLSESASASTLVKDQTGATGGALSAADSDLETLTAAYEQARYGDYELSAPQIAALTSDVDRLLQRLGQHPG